MVNLNSNMEIIPFNINGLNTIIKRQRLSDWIKTVKTLLHTVYKECTLNVMIWRSCK